MTSLATFGCLNFGLEKIKSILYLHLFNLIFIKFPIFLLNTIIDRYIQALNFFANLGTCLAPVVSNPFMIKRDELDEVIDENVKMSTMSPIVKTETPNLPNIKLITDILTQLPIVNENDENRSQIEIPYAFIGVILFITGILINLLYMCVPYTSPSTYRRKARDDPLKEQIQLPVTPDRVRRSHFWIVLVFGSLIPCFYFSLSRNNFTYLQSFAMEIGYKKATATFMFMIYSSVVTFACLCFMLLSTILSPQSIIYLELIILISAECILLYLCHWEPTMIWVGVCLLGFGISSIYPSLYSFIKQRIDVSNNVGSIVVFTGSLISFVFPIVEGNYLQKYPSTFPLINLFATVCILVLFTLMHSADFYFGFPLKTALHTNEPDVYVTEISTTSFSENPNASF